MSESCERLNNIIERVHSWDKALPLDHYQKWAAVLVAEIDRLRELFEQTPCRDWKHAPSGSSCGCPRCKALGLEMKP